MLEKKTDRKYQALLEDITEASRESFADSLVGVYLHGSLAMGCFHPDKSDIDLLFVVDGDITDAQKMLFMKKVVELNASAPAKGLELSVVKREVCKPFVYPTPFALHFSPTHLQWFMGNPEDYVEHMKGVDKDLAAHVTILKHCGVVLYGEEIDAVFGEVSRKHYIDSIWYDVEGAKEDVLENPMYIILNLCRVAAFLEAGLVTSKKQGGEWGMEKLPKAWHDLLARALRCYETEEVMHVEKAEAEAFCEAMLQRIRSKI